MRLLIVNADDFGLNREATDGIAECHMAGSVTSTTLMANAPDVERAAEIGCEMSRLGIGLHFNLTWGEPVHAQTGQSSLGNGRGLFHSRSVLARRLMLGRVAVSDVDRELRAQWHRVVSLGIQPTHIDSHQHVHGFPAVFAAVAAFAHEQRVPVRVPWVASVGGGLGRRARRFVLSRLLATAVRPWIGKLRWNDSLNSVFDLPGMAARGHFDDVDYGELIAAAKGPVHELMVHATTNATAMSGYTRIGAVSTAEFDYLRRGTLPTLAAEHGFSLGTFRDLR